MSAGHQLSSTMWRNLTLQRRQACRHACVSQAVSCPPKLHLNMHARLCLTVSAVCCLLSSSYPPTVLG